MSSHQEEVLKNYKHFKANEDRWFALKGKKFVLLKNQKEVGFYDTFEESLQAGKSKFKSRSYSIQEIRREPLRLNALDNDMF